jgi:hypothetical protein
VHRRKARLNTHCHDDLKAYIPFFTHTLNVAVKYSQQTSKETQVFWGFQISSVCRSSIDATALNMRLLILSRGEWNGAVTKHQPKFPAVHFGTTLYRPTSFKKRERK